MTSMTIALQNTVILTPVTLIVRVSDRRDFIPQRALSCGNAIDQNGRFCPSYQRYHQDSSFPFASSFCRGQIQLASLTQKEKELLGANLSLSLLRSWRGCSPWSAMVGSLSLEPFEFTGSAPSSPRSRCCRSTTPTFMQMLHLSKTVQHGAARHASAWTHAPRRAHGSPEAGCVVVGADRISQGLQIRSPARGSAFSNRCSRRSKQHERFDGVEQENSSIDKQLRESWETREE